MVFVISVVAVISANPALNSLFVDVRVLFVIFVVFVIFVIFFVQGDPHENDGVRNSRLSNQKRLTRIRGQSFPRALSISGKQHCQVRQIGGKESQGSDPLALNRVSRRAVAVCIISQVLAPFSLNSQGIHLDSRSLRLVMFFPLQKPLSPTPP